ncbi:MAG TPA: LptA/OstA family protein [Verrucomicrobiae bacterium]|jgi:lipopolysaccharide transport protein LptA
MKVFNLIAVAALCASAVRAQTNANTAASSAPRPATRIQSASVDFDMTGRRAVYHGNVRVDDPQMKLTCAQLVVDLPPDAGHPNHIVAETNVVIDFTDAKGQTMHATSDKAVYVYEVQNGATNETVTLTGNAKVENAQGWLTGEPIIWNRANNSLSAMNQKMIFRQNLDSMKAGTNSPPAK